MFRSLRVLGPVSTDVAGSRNATWLEFRAARRLVDLVHVDDPEFRSLRVVARRVYELVYHVVDVAAHVSRGRKRRRVSLDVTSVDHIRERAAELRLARARGAREEHLRGNRRFEAT